MIAKSRDKAYFIYLAELFHLDPTDQLVMEDHAIDEGVLCITHSITKRALQVRLHEWVVELDYLDGTSTVQKLQVYDSIPVAKRTIAFLNRETDQI